MITRSLLTLLLYGLSLCTGARILAIFPFELKSHRGVLEPIIEELAVKGHHVDVISTFKLSKNLPNYTNILTLPTSKEPPKILYSDNYTPYDDYVWLVKVNNRVCNLLGHPVISELIKNPPKNPPYDLLIVHILSGYQCMSAIGVALDIPVVGVMTTLPYPQMEHYLHNPLHLAGMSRHCRSFEENFGFWGRLYNVVMTNYYITHHYKHADAQDHYIKKYLGPNMPSYREIEKSYSLIFSNSHYLYHGVKPKVPGLIEIGGINVMNDTSPMDPKLKKVLDESKDGFIYFSFGSVVVVESLPHEIVDKFYSTIRKVAPIRVILKSSNPETLPKNLPKNVFTFPWLPQQKVLQHPNIKAFVAHGGALGTLEAIYYRVPMICVPFFAEQYVNCDISKHRNISLKLDIKTAVQKDYDYVFSQILTNPFYKQSINKFSALYWDRPQSPREAVTYWVEFVLRHGKDVLRTQGLALNWWQLELLDVYVFLITCALTTVLIVCLIARKILRLFLQVRSMSSIVKSSKKLM
ncbi:UDP-glucuronosyltransferase [Copidosoma floridanum]|uniref:UDP-glucuronosyltransferase n=1 Tax=Copidosoma floridanum TaxID=29053 RepID=UPI0006C94DE5|nr:UDP-glucuronosyltransferase [Copidosoma floridanum]